PSVPRSAPMSPTEPAMEAAPASKRRSNSRPKLNVDQNALGPSESTAEALGRAKTAPPPRPNTPVATTRRTNPIPGSGTDTDLDLDALERAAAESQTPFYKQIQDLPPPPASVLGKKSGNTTTPAQTTY